MNTAAGDAPVPVLSVLTVSWNDWPKLRRCLASIQASMPDKTEIIVIDNNSANGAQEQLRLTFPTVRVVSNPVNFGHTRAVNQAFGLATGEFVLLVDSDTEFEPDCIATLHACLAAHPEFDLVAPRTFNRDGTVQETARNLPHVLSIVFGRQSLMTRLFPGNAISRRYLARQELGGTAPFTVQQIGGACMFFRRTLLRDAGLWDERYFGYWVDTDWCWNLHKLKRKVACVPAARIVHDESNARGKRKSVRRIWVFYYGAYQLYTKWCARGWYDPRSIAALVVLTGVACTRIAACAVSRRVAAAGFGEARQLADRPGRYR